MRKLLFLPLFLLLAACGSAAAPVATSVPESAGDSDAAAPQEAELDSSESNAADLGDKSDVVTGATPQEAAVVREQDHVKGADDPLVTIIEYGDFQ